MKRTGLTYSSRACLTTVSVCVMTPSTESTTTRPPSMTLRERVTWPVKSTWPGVSTKLIRYGLPPYSKYSDMLAALTVICLSCSMGT